MVELRPNAKTYYEIAGPAHGHPVVLVHDFSVPSCVWDGTFEHLAQAGFRVVRYDLYGVGAQTAQLIATMAWNATLSNFGPWLRNWN